MSHEFLAEGDELVAPAFEALQLVGEFKLEGEEGGLQGKRIRCCPDFVHAEELEVAAEVEDAELLLVGALNEAFAQAGAAADYLPELRLVHHFLEESGTRHAWQSHRQPAL